MKRFATAAVAAVTAMSLFTAPAMAQDDIATSHKGSMEIGAKIGSNSSEGRQAGSVLNYLEFYKSSYENDAKNEYDLGSTADMLWAAAIIAALVGGAVAAVQAGMIPGVALPF